MTLLDEPALLVISILACVLVAILLAVEDRP
jgi:hypothetical protein